jgi:hypothetical protein
MNKYFFSLIIFLLITNFAIGQKSDTTILFFKTIDGITIPTSSLQDATYFRMVLPADSGDDRHNIREYYKSGKIKLVGKEYAVADLFNPQSISIMFDGDCVSYFENGKKAAVAHYLRGDKDGLEYLFYPSGKVYCAMKYVLNSLPRSWECYDTLGNMTCSKGNGKWILYDDQYQNVELEGQVVNGLREGIWRGSISRPDSISYQYLFKGGHRISSVGFDKKGLEYPFKTAHEPAAYRSGPVTFVDVLRGHIKIPRDSSGRKLSIDTLHVSFVVDKEGHIDDFNMPGQIPASLKDAVFSALLQCDHWSPYKLYGIPVCSQVIFPLDDIIDFSKRSFTKLFVYEERTLNE